MSDYNGPIVGYTDYEMANVIGMAVLEAIEKEGMEIIWSKNA